MKRYLKIFLIFAFCFILFIFGNSVKAATCSLNTNKTTATVGDTITATVSVTAAQWDLTLTANGTKLNTWTETVNYKSNLSKTFTATYKASAEGTVTFALVGDITDVNQTNTQINTSKAVTVNKKTTTTTPSTSKPSTTTNPSTSSTTKPSTTPTTPTFTSANKTVYTTGQVNLRSSWSTSSSATSVAKGTKLTLTGTSTQKVNGYIWYRVSYNGTTKYIASSLVTSTKPAEEKKSNNNNLSSLSIEGVEISPKFSKSVTSYTANVSTDVNELNITAKTENSKATAKIEGNKDLVDGENTVKITVTAEDKTTKTYTIKVTKSENAEAPSTPIDDGTLKLSNLEIARISFGDQGFNPDIYSYEINLNVYTEKLDITATPNQADAKVEIVGNDGFVEGENVLNILLTSADGKTTVSYQIKVNVPAPVEEEEGSIIPVVVGCVIAGAIIMVIIIVVIRKRNNQDEYEDGNEEDIYSFKPMENERKKEPAKKAYSNKEDLDKFLDTSELDDDRLSKGSKGKHSAK